MMPDAHGSNTLKAFMATSSCPKCGRTLQQSGEATCEGETFPVFQCDECIVSTKLGDETFDGALTFALDKHGRRFDPAEPPPEVN
jgi:hypothetical protein